MENEFSGLRINSERFQADFDALAAIGSTGDGGVHRPAFSEAHLQARTWFLESAKTAGLDTSIDQAGNHIAAFRNPNRNNFPALLMGSHLDSVPRGGQFDGALGVLAGLEVLRTIKESQISLDMNLEVYDFTDEEGLYIGLLGSQALTGLLSPHHLPIPEGKKPAFATALKQAGLKENSLHLAQRDPQTIAGYLELHIEQAQQLIRSEANIGVVTNIVGIRSFKIHFIGRADHAGTTSMDSRFDAGLGASAWILEARSLVLDRFPGCVVTCGNMDFDPGVFNVIPKRVAVSMEFRGDSNAKLDELEEQLLNLAGSQAANFGLALEVEKLESVSPAPMNPEFQQTINQACHTLNLKPEPLSSGAGHDAQSLAQICPTGMIFIPSVKGFSHSSREFSQWQDCVNGANVLLHTVLLMARPCACQSDKNDKTKT